MTTASCESFSNQSLVFYPDSLKLDLSKSSNLFTCSHDIQVVFHQVLLSASTFSFHQITENKKLFFSLFCLVQTDCRYLNKTQTSFLLYTILPHYYSLSLNVASQILYFSLVYLHKKKPTAGTSSGVITVQYLRQSHATVTRNFLKVGT